MAEPLSILQVNTTDTKGGAANVAMSLHRAYRDRGLESRLAVGEKCSDDRHVVEIAQERDNSLQRGLKSLGTAAARRLESDRLRKQVVNAVEWKRRWDTARGREDFHFPGSRRLLELFDARPDILHLHNLHGGYFDLRALTSLSERVPTVVTLHDAWLTTGHCAHTFTCDRWRIGCGSCPDLTIYPAIPRDATRYNWSRKESIFERSRLYLTAPSQWLLDRALQSMLAEAVVDARVIPNGTDTNLFRPGDGREMRDRLKISRHARVVLAVGQGMRTNRWKDFATLKRALRLIEGDGVEVVVIGDEAPPEGVEDVQVHFVPYVSDQRELADYYRMADVYVHPARVDTFPSTVLEAMASGLPVVASRVGGIVEQIAAPNTSEGQPPTGLLVEPGDPQDLADALRQLLDDHTMRAALGRSGRATVGRRFTLDVQASAYVRWYEEIAATDVIPARA